MHRGGIQKHFILRLSDCQKAFTLRAFALQFAGTTHSFRLLAGAFFRWLFKMIATLHFTESAFTLHFFLKSFQRLINVVFAHYNLNQGPSPVNKS